MKNISRSLQTGLRLLAVATGLLLSQNLQAAVTFTVMPPTVSNTYNGTITLQIAGLTNGETVLIQKYLNLSGQGVLATNDWLVQQFNLTDGQPGMVFGGVTNFNVPGDTDATAGQITAVLNFQNGDFIQNIAGAYLFKLSSPVGHFSPLTNQLSVTNFPYAQKFTGTVVSNGSSTVVPNAVVLMEPQGSEGGPKAGVVANSSGNYTLPASAGTYGIFAVSSGYLFTSSKNGGGPELALAAGQTLTTNLTITNATASITGSLVDANNSSLGLPGVLMYAQGANGLMGISFTQPNGSFSLGVLSSPVQWDVGASDTGFLVDGYLRLQDTNVNVGTTGLTLSVPKGTALFYGSVQDNLGNPVQGVEVQTRDNTGAYKGDSYSDANGNYVTVAVGGLNNDTWQVEVNNSPANYLFSEPSFDQNGGANISVGEALQVNFAAILATNTISGYLTDAGGNPFAGIGVNANTTSGVNYNQYTDTDANGYYSLGVANGTWQVSVSTCSDCSDGLPEQYFCPSQTVVISNNNATINLTASLAPYTISGFLKDNNNNPIAGVNIYAYTTSGVNYNQNAVTAADGAYTLYVVKGTWQVGVNSCTDCNQSLPANYLDPQTQSVVVSGNSVNNVNFTAILAPYTISGSLEDNYGNPIAGVNVYAYTTSGSSYNQNAVTGANGDYSIYVINGNWQVGVNSCVNCGQSLPANYLDPASQPVQVSNDSVNNVNFTAILATNAISGSVRQANGSIIPGVGVSANATINNVGYSQYVDADPNGNYSMYVANGSWSLSLNCNNGGSDSLDNILGSGNYACPNNQSATISGNNATVNFIVQSCGGISILGGSPPNGQVGVHYDQFAQASSCNGNFTWSLVSGSVPPGLTGNANGELYGTPTTAGTYTFTIKVTDGAGLTATETVSMTIIPEPLLVATTYLPYGEAGVFYSQQLQAVSGQTPYTWSLTPGSASPPLNLTLTTNGLLSGTPASSGTFSFSVRVTDSAGATADQLLSLLVGAPTASDLFLCYTNNGAITITNYIGGSAPVFIPANINGWPVATIGNSAFTDDRLTGVVIPDSVTSIGDSAFSGCVNLTNVTIGSGVTSIGDSAFNGCSNLASVTIGSGVISIGDYAFELCTSLISITIPNSVTSIGVGAFFECHSLASVTIANSVTSIGDDAFESCTSLTSVYFLGNAPTADSTVFYQDTNVTVYYLPGATGWLSYFAGVPTALWVSGSLQVTITPQGAITAGAQWQVDGGTLQHSGATVTNLSVGGHTVSFSMVSGWTTPSNQPVSVIANSTTATTGTYVQAQGGVWVEKAPMPTARYGVGVGVVNGILYAVGGQAPDRVATVESYNPVSNTWATTNASMLLGRAGCGVAVVNGILYVFGGWVDQNDDNTSEVEAYDPASDTWTEMASMPDSRADPGVAVINGIIYVVGGGQSHIDFSNLWAYDPTTNGWTILTPKPTATAGTGVGVINGILYAVGGGTGSTPGSAGYGACTTVNEAYDPVSNSWTERAPCPAGAEGVEAAALNGLLYLLVCPSGTTTSLYAYNPASDTWTTNAPLPADQFSPGLGVANGSLFAVGGWDTNGNLVAVNEAFTPSSLSTGSLQVTISPAGAITAGAQWQVDGGALQISGATVSNLSVGNHTVSFNTVSGWTPPPNQTVSISANSTTTIIAAYAQAGVWTTNYASSPTARGAEAVAALNGVLCLAGGHAPDSTDSINTFEAFDPSSDGWTTLPSLPVATQQAGAGVVNGILYVVSGCSCCENLNTLQAYNPASGSWTSMAPIPVAVTGARVAVVNGILYAFGGGLWGLYPSAAVQAYNPATDTWTAKTSIPTVRGSGAIGVVNGIIYYMGGIMQDGTEVATVEAYNPATDTWTTGYSPMPTARGYAGSGVLNGLIYVVGGYNGTTNVSTVEAYNPATDTWTTEASLPAGLQIADPGNPADVINGVLYAVCGDQLSNQNGSGVRVIAAYTQAQLNSLPTGSLQVTITPAGAVAAGAQWQVDGGSFQTNGATVSGLSSGTDHTLAFKVLYGWSTPSNQLVTITGGTTTTNTGVYTPQKVKDVTLTVTSPKPGQSLNLTNDAFTVTGMARDTLPAKDDVVVESVYYQLNETNGGSWTLATPGNSWSNWTAGVILNPGPNTIRAYAVDAGSNASSITKVAFNYIPSAVLDLATNGLGSVTPNDGGKFLAIKTNYTLTATPGKNWIFSNWVASGSESFVSNTPALKFTMQSNLTLRANFVTNVFLAAKGTYIGLFAPTNAPRRQTNSGAFKFTVTSTGALSGKLTIGTNTPSLIGQFNPAGVAIFPTPRKGLSTLTNTLQLDFTNQSVQGTIGDGSFLASLLGDQEVFSSSHKAADYEGAYTFIIPGTNDSTVGPFGVSYGTATVGSTGTITYSVYLADGTSVLSQSSVVSEGGYWPFYLPLYGGNGSLWSWNYFNAANGTLVAGTNASWINEANSAKAAVYRAGFTNPEVALSGSSYYAPADKPLLSLTSAQVLLEGGNLPFSITNEVTWTPKNTILLTNAADTNKLTLTINKTSGVISGSFANPSSPKDIIKVNGVLLQNKTNAQGYFLGTDESGTFLLENQNP